MGETRAIEPLPARAAAPVVAEVLVPLIARGLIIRRRGAVGLLARLDADRRATNRLRALRADHGPGPVLLKLPGRRLALILSSDDARAVLGRSPDPFTPANREKRAALARFEPHGVLISAADERPPRRAFNERALETGRAVHDLAEPIRARVTGAVDALLEPSLPAWTLRWPEFQRTFNRLVRGVVLGAAAVGDEQLGSDLETLRRDANWGYLLPQRQARRERFLTRLRTYLQQPDPDALSGHIAALADRPGATQEAVQQVPQWLFAFDAAAIAGFATLALLGTHPAAVAAARAEADRSQDQNPSHDELPFTRACVLECLRLWPTTPAILRDTTAETRWRTGSLPAGSAVLIFAPLFHRDESPHPDPDSFSPDRWLDGEGRRLRPDGPDASTVLLPFSRGPAGCPGRELVLLVCSQLIAHFLHRAELELKRPRASLLRPGRPLPATLDHFGLELGARARTPTPMRSPERMAT